MGCFDVSCGISNITIKQGDDALLLLIVPFTEYPRSLTYKRDKNVEINKGLYQVFNEGPLGLYIPFCLPIRGKYNDYGSLEELVKDDALKALEGYFSASFDQIVEVLHRSKYTTLHDEEMLAIYGNGLNINRNGKITPKWLIEAGFTETDGKYFHPEVSTIKKMKGDKLNDTGEPQAYVVFKEPINGFDSDKDKKLAHIIYWEGDEWKERWEREQRDFCNHFMDCTRSRGWMSDTGVVLGLKKEFLEKAITLMNLSGMFIDGKIYDELTLNGVKTNRYYSAHSNILNGYMNKHLMDLIGFKYERGVDDKTKKEPDFDSYFDLEHLYSHKDAPGFMFGIRDAHSMATDMYTLGKNGELTDVKRHGNKGYHPFSPKGLAEMFKGVTGNELDLSGLDGVTKIDVTFLKIKEFKKKKDAFEDLESKLDYTDDKAEAKKLRQKAYRLRNEIEENHRRRDVFGDLNFPFVLDLYDAQFTKPSKKFKQSCQQFNNFISSMYGINKYLIPSAHIGQHGDYLDQLSFNLIITKVVKDKISGDSNNEFDDHDEFIEVLHKLYGDIKSQDADGEIEYLFDEKVIGIWNKDDNYGYLEKNE